MNKIDQIACMLKTNILTLFNTKKKSPEKGR